jgi:hypothetical protein
VNHGAPWEQALRSQSYWQTLYHLSLRFERYVPPITGDIEMRYRLLGLSCACVLIVNGSLLAQGVGEREAVELAVARHVAASLPTGRIALARNVDARGGRSLTQTQALLHTLGGASVIDAEEDSVLVCGAVPSTCRLQGVAAVVTITVDTIAGNAAEATVTVQQATDSPRAPLYLSSTTWRLTKTGAAWRVAEAKVSRRS